MAKRKVKPTLSVAKSVALMNMRQKQLDHAQLARKVDAVGETSRAALLHGNVHQGAQRMQGELRAAEQQGGVSMQQRREHTRRLAALQKAAASALMK